jgi:hypothetical protein
MTSRCFLQQSFERKVMTTQIRKLLEQNETRHEKSTNVKIKIDRSIVYALNDSSFKAGDDFATSLHGD